MTRISKKIITWLLGALAFVALSFGIVFTMPQTKVAKAADTAVTFSAAALGDAKHDSYGTSIRFDTSGLQWESYHNWVAAADWASIADYTTVNGRTVTEINNATTHSQKITFMMQPAGSFSFLRLYIPAEIMPLGEVKAMGILDGWSFNNGTNNYTSSAVSFIRSGDAMVPASSYSAETKLTASDISISEAKLVHRLYDNSEYASRSADSYIVDINIGASKSYPEYDTMYDGYKTIRNSIYINGKSIDEWNSQKIAEDARFNEPSTYTYFPQNSTDPSHKDWFAKPVGFWGTSTGFRLTIFQELVADCETVTVTVGQGCTKAGNFMVAESKSVTVLTQKVVDITNMLTFLDNSVHNPSYWGETKLYFVHTNNNACWTKTPKGGCLNEYDPSNAGGGQIQMKYVTFNGSTLWDINKNDNGSYGSGQENIASGSIYAPILVTMSSELGSALKLTVPTAFTNGAAGHEEVVIKKGFNVKEGDTSYYVTNDVVFTNNNTTAWKKEVKGVEIATEVTGIVTKANRTDGGTNENFVIFQISNNDYAGLNTTPITDISSLYGYIDIGGTVIESCNGEKFFNVWGVNNSIAFRFSDAATLQNIPYITIKAGAKFPSYNAQNGGKLTYFVTQEDITFVHSIPNDVWTVGEKPAEEYTVTYTVDGATYHSETVPAGQTVTAPAAPTKAEDAAYTYTFDCWMLDGVAFDFNTPIKGNLTLEANFTAHKKASTVNVTGLTFEDQGHGLDGSGETETYLIKTSGLAWTYAGTGVLNLDHAEALEYIYFNGRSIAEINAESDDTFGSISTAINKHADCAPIAVLYNKLSETSSYLQIWVPTNYPNLGVTAEVNHQSIEIKAGFSIKQDSVTYTITQDIKWIQLNGSWVNADTTFSSETVTIGNPRVDGSAKELYKVDITSSSWAITCNNYDFMYGGFAEYRKFIFINGVSIYDINVNTDDSSYQYSSFPMTGVDDATFAHPVLIQTHNQESDQNTITIWIHENYIKSLGDNITITLGAGYNAYTSGKSLDKNVDYDMTAEITVNDGTKISTFTVVKGTTIESIYGTPFKEMTETAIYDFDNWYIAGTETIYDASAPITEDISVEARFNETKVNLIETEVVGITHYLKTSSDNWLAFELSENDYAAASENFSMGGYEELLRIGFLDKVVLKGTIVLANGSTVSEATLLDVYKSYGPQEGPLLNFWSLAQFGMRLPVGDGVEEIVIKEGCYFPSYAYVSGTETDTRYVVMQEATYKYDENVGAFVKQAALHLDFNMEMGAAVRITSNMDTSGIRFQTKIAKSDIEMLDYYINELGEKYVGAIFGTLIVPKDYLMGGTFTHEWLSNSGMAFIDIPSTVTFDEGFPPFPVEDENYYSYFGSIVKLKASNYGREFVGRGYILLTLEDGEEVYIYANYDSTNSRSASFVANAAINDRNPDQDSNYKHLTENNNYSPYTKGQRTFLENYLVRDAEWSVSAINSQDLPYLKDKGGSQSITPGTQKLEGPYVELIYSTNVNVWGEFTYTDGSKTAKEDFYLQAGTTSHKQYLDIFRYNGVGYGMNVSNLSMTSIKFTNAELEAGTTGKVKVFGLYSQMKTIDTANQEIYLTVAQNNGSEMTVGAHLGIGGALTYLAKSGLYEGVIGGSSGWKNGTVALSTNKGIFDATNRYKSGSSTSSYSTEAGYYGHATSSKPSDGAVNLINNFDAGRQIQQSWYAQVGGSDTATDGSNGYTRAYCYTGSTKGQYWPYNPVQAGDVVSNPGQIIDYDVNAAKGYIYVKTRAMDWAKGRDTKSSNSEHNNIANTVEGGVTTKSYMENYYRLNSDGTVVVNNSFIDWNGFTDMDTCNWASTELPAVYPVQTLNYYVSNINGDGTWADALEYKNDMKPWSGGTAYHQFANPNNGDTKVEDWFAWANGGDGNAIGLGMYIPNVARFTSGRSNTSTAYYTDANFQNSNAKPVDNYTEWSWSSFKNVDMVTDLAERGNILADKGMMSNMQEIKYTYQSAYVSNTSYTAPGVDFRMEAYVPIEYSYVLCVDTVANIRSTFKGIKNNGTITNAGNGYQKVGLDAWARADKKWTW